MKFRKSTVSDSDASWWRAPETAPRRRPSGCLATTMALYQASDFTGFSDSYAVPAGSSDVIFTGSVDQILEHDITKYIV